MSMSQPGVDPDRMVSLDDEEAVRQDANPFVEQVFEHRARDVDGRRIEVSKEIS